MKIRTKMMLGFLILATMLAAAGAFSIYELMSIGVSVQKLLDDNYRSINAAKSMIEALEREDSGTLLLLSGQWKTGREMITVADESFRQAFDIASHNLTVPDEDKYVTAIDQGYAEYSRLWDRPIAGTDLERNIDWYFQDVHGIFLKVKGAVQELMTLNDQAMYHTASELKNRAHRAVMPGIVAIVSALVFTLIFNFFVHLYIVNPIVSINRSLKEFLKSGKPIKVDVETKDELFELSNTIKDISIMLAKLT